MIGYPFGKRKPASYSTLYPKINSRWIKKLSEESFKLWGENIEKYFYILGQRYISEADRNSINLNRKRIDRLITLKYKTVP